MERCWLEWTRWPVSPLLCTVGSWKAIMRPNCRTMMSTGSLSVAAELFVYTYNISKIHSISILVPTVPTIKYTDWVD